DPTIRGEVWPFLLQFYSCESTSEERESLRIQKRTEYEEIQNKRLSMTSEEQEEFWRKIQFTVDKDVVRTDRSKQFFKGENNPNVEAMRNILLNYAVYNPEIGYSQGMSDLVAPILSEVRDESDTFWCFVGLMQNTIFISSPRDDDMERQLLYLRELLRLMHPRFYQHLVNLGEDGLQMLFCHRWILLCFKREFPEAEALRIWEACWAHYQTDYFHLFVCVAIVVIYGDDVIEQQLATDQMLLHFSNLAMHMSGEIVLRKVGTMPELERMPNSGKDPSERKVLGIATPAELITKCAEHQLVITNTLFCQKTSSSPHYQSNDQCGQLLDRPQDCPLLNVHRVSSEAAEDEETVPKKAQY
ncbi:TBC1 domain family member 16-like, partial [Rhincodon typus]|uniref:TBC1 domain family member 16-like n=1 Tax=Rhincodon typus TaxID=259920 RepID=UPI00202FA196